MKWSHGISTIFCDDGILLLLAVAKLILYEDKKESYLRQAGSTFN